MVGIFAVALAVGQKDVKMSDQEIVTKHFVEKGWGTPVRTTLYEHVPFLYKVDFADKGDYVLIHNHKIVSAKGLPAMLSYMKDVKLMSQPKLTIDEMIRLMIVFNAFPPEHEMSGGSYYTGSDFPKLEPKLDRGGTSEGKISFCYLLPDPLSGFPVEHPAPAKVRRWTLDVPKSYAAKWKQETFEIDTSQR
jgi:hypothetical protein